MSPLRIAILALALVLPSAQADDVAPLTLAGTIALPDVEGRIDHLAIDLQGERLFVAALGNSTVEVVDLRAGVRTQTLKGFDEPQGMVFLETLNRLAVTNGGRGTCELRDGQTLARLAAIAVGEDADNMRYDPATHYLYIGYGNGAVGIVDAATGTRVGDITLQSHPESLQLESAGSRVYANVPAAHEIAVLDRAQQRTIAEWPIGTIAQANFPMALDETHHRLFVGFRQPAKLAVFDTTSGTLVAAVDCVGDADDIFYDAARQRVYVAGGAGALEVFTQGNADTYQRVARISTPSGSRTALYVPQRNQLFLAVPHRGAQRAEIRIYAAPGGAPES